MTQSWVTDLPVVQHPILLEEISHMLLRGAIEEITGDDPGFYSPFFLVPKKGGEWHPVLNLKGLS